MPGKWLRTSEVTREAMVAGQNTYDLPKSNFIGYIDVNIAGTGCATQTLLTAACNFTSVRVEGNGSTILKDYTLRDVRCLNIFDYGTAPVYWSGITESVQSALPFRIDFGRFVHDEISILPAKMFKQLVLRITATAVTGANLWDAAPSISIEVEQYISADKPTEKVILKDTIISTTAAAATQVDYDLPLGLWLRALMLMVDEMTGNWYNLMSLRVNNGAEIPWTGEMQMQVSVDAAESNITYATYTAAGHVPGGAELNELTAELEDSTYQYIDLDPTRTLKDVLHTETMNDLKFRMPRAASTHVKALAREYIVLGGE